MFLEFEKCLGLGVSGVELLKRGVQSVGEVISAFVFDRGIDNRLGHHFHFCIIGRRNGLAEKQHISEDIFICESEEGSFVLIDTPNSHVE